MRGENGNGGAAAAGGSRKKVASAGFRRLMVVDCRGGIEVMEAAGKQSIMRRSGIPARDLRILDPLLSYPSTLLGRGKSIVINLEHIKSIVTAKEVLLFNSADPAVIPFAQDLQRRILHHHHHNQNTGGPKILPFEFVVLEACLEAACTFLDTEATTLEQEAYPALDKLTSKISTLNLERVRRIKSRLVAISGRVQKARDELEHLLDDNEDMAEMYLTDKITLQRLDGSSSPLSSLNEGDGISNGVFQSDQDEGIRLGNFFEADGIPNNYGDFRNIVHPDNLLGVPNGSIRDISGTLTSATHSVISKQLDIKELEMLLEAYFVQIDGTLNKLSTLREYVHDTEDYINIMLDDKQNHLLRMGVMLTTATVVMTVFVVVVAVFGMNIHIDLFTKWTLEFYWIVGGSSVASIFLYVIAIAWCKHKRLLE